ncbi:restriction endonuclease [Aliifodinibius sp. S!AR15-10]|uniref:restriction endonuclease n=1 Tax=Aliifodinibius sp. S!AR15-10 TaxID=2950437 RepID=UPI00286617FA|nr:restriction endonuclease [Aliifodinibius sp. S!AR15-10]MDR8394331.1 restriction endonuclease [Aliifodinibius sp. S!AR15-10]
MGNELSKNNIVDILESYYPERFQNLSPIDFEGLIKFLLQEKYAKAELTKASGDFGADVIAYSPSQGKIICQVKRYNKGNRVGNKYINDCIGAIEYYNGNKGLVITTSSYTRSAKEIANRANIELWNWNKLSEEISKHFFEGKDYYNYFNKVKQSDLSQETLNISLDRIEQGGATKGNASYNWIYITIENLTKKIIEVSIIDVKIINSNNQQFSFDQWHKGYFSSGEIFPKAKVEASFNVSKQKAGQLKSGTRVYLKATINDENQLFELEYQKDNHKQKPNGEKSIQNLIKEDIGDKLILKSPVSGEFNQWVIGTNGKVINPYDKIAEVDDIELKAGCRGYLNEICVENHTYIKAGKPIIILDTELSDSLEKKNQSNSNSNNDSDIIAILIAFAIVIITIILVIAANN